MNAWVGIGIGTLVSLFFIWMFDLTGVYQILFVAFLSFFIAVIFGEGNEVDQPRFWGEYFGAFVVINLFTTLIALAF